MAAPLSDHAAGTAAGDFFKSVEKGRVPSPLSLYALQFVPSLHLLSHSSLAQSWAQPMIVAASEGVPPLCLFPQVDWKKVWGEGTCLPAAATAATASGPLCGLAREAVELPLLLEQWGRWQWQVAGREEEWSGGGVPLSRKGKGDAGFLPALGT